MSASYNTFENHCDHPVISWIVIFFSFPSNGLINIETSNSFIWLVVYLLVWRMMEFVSWDYEYEIPNWMERHKLFMFQTTNQILYTIANFLANNSITSHNVSYYNVLHHLFYCSVDGQTCTATNPFCSLTSLLLPNKWMPWFPIKMVNHKPYKLQKRLHWPNIPLSSQGSSQNSLYSHYTPMIFALSSQDFPRTCSYCKPPHEITQPNNVVPRIPVVTTYNRFHAFMFSHFDHDSPHPST